jgi:putative two-component system response regulator
VNKPFDLVEVLMRIHNTLEVSLVQRRTLLQKKQLEKIIREQTGELRQSRREIVQRLGRAAEFRNYETGSHLARMSRYAAQLGEVAGLQQEECDLILDAMPMHDIGKIGIPDHILMKPGRLTPKEWEIMKTHPRIGAELLSGGESPLLQMAEVIALTHHEKWDGSGYPNKLAGEDIPFVGRICAVCDVFDALTTKRVYKEAWDIESAMGELHHLKGSHLDLHLVELFEDILADILQVKNMYPEEDSEKSLKNEEIVIYS